MKLITCIITSFHVAHYELPYNERWKEIFMLYFMPNAFTSEVAHTVHEAGIVRYTFSMGTLKVEEKFFQGHKK